MKRFTVVIAGAGVTERNIMFSYHADWQALGRWSVEVLTYKRRFIFRPMKQLLLYRTVAAPKPGLF